MGWTRRHRRVRSDGPGGREGGSRRGLHDGTIGALLVALLVASQVPAAAAAPGGVTATPATATPATAAAATKGTPDPAPPAPERCTLRATAGNTTDEFASCISVGASLSRLPAVGEQATLDVAVTAQYARDGVDVTIDLPATLAYVEPPAGAQVADTRAPYTTAGTAQRAEVHADLAAGETRHVQARVTAVEAGPGTIRAHAVAVVPGGTDGGGDQIALTVAPSGATSRAGLHDARADQTTRATARAQARTDAPSAGARAHLLAPAAPTASPRPADRTRPGTTGRDQATTGALEQPHATVCATGNWYYVDAGGTTRPSVNVTVEVWDADATGGNDLLASGVAHWSGDYNICFDNADTDEGGLVDPYIRFVTQNGIWKVQDGSGAAYAWISGTVTDMSADHDFGGLQPGSATKMAALEAFDNANSAWAWVPHGTGSCWDKTDTSCRTVDIIWTPTSTDGDYFVPADNQVHLTAAAASEKSTVVHEIGHAVMDDVYEDHVVPTTNCSPHYIALSSSAGCAWSEGFAEWFPAMVFDDPAFHFGDGTSQDLENNTWNYTDPYQTWDDGDAVEGRVASALIDISDTANEWPWDRYGEGAPGNVWDTFLTHVSDTFADFWASRGADGYDVADTGARASLFQSTVDYGFRDPLADYLAAVRPQPAADGPHNYAFTTSTGYWSVVALRPPTGTDDDLTVYDDRAQGTTLASSTWGSDVVDLVAIDSNSGRRTVGDDYYPRVTHYSGTGDYTVQLAQGTDQLTSGTSQAVTFAAADVVKVRDVSLTAGVPASFEVVPAAGQDLELLLFGSSDATGAVQGRSDALSIADDAGAGGAETLTYTPSTTGWYGLAVVNRGGAGAATLSSGPFTLDVTRTGTGATGGTVTSDPAGITCGTDCTEAYAAGTSVTLYAAFATGTTFDGWSGGGCTGQAPCTVTMDQARSVTATFSTQTFPLTVNTPTGTGTGTVTSTPSGIDCPGDCTETYDYGTSVTLTAAADAGSSFGGWGVTDCPGTGGCTLTMDAAKSVTPSFTLDTSTTSPDLTVTTLTDAPLFADPGGTFPVDETTANLGDGDAAASTTAFYLSADDVVDGGDIRLADTLAVGSLPAGGASADSAVLTVPGDTPVGAYLLLACADDTNTVAESDEANNCLAGTVFVNVGSPMHAAVASHFDSDAEGWTVSGDPAGGVTHLSVGGDPGGALSITDGHGGSIMRWVAPTSYLGDHGDAAGGALSFALRQDTPGNPITSDDDVTLAGAGLTLTAPLDSNPPVDGWRQYTVPLDPVAGWVDGGGAPADATTLATVLSDVTSLTIRAEYSTDTDTDGLDEVVLYAPDASTPPPSSSTTGARRWDFADDFRFGADAANPSPDQYGNAAVWSELAGATMAHDPTSYEVLTEHVTACNGSTPGFEVWQLPGGTGPPIGANGADTDQVCGTLTAPAHHGYLHPDSSRLAVIAWTSPITGTVAVTGGLSDDDPNGGDGIAWSIDAGATTLASGSYDNGGAQSFADGTGGDALRAVPVTAGNVLYLTVDPRGSYTYDATEVDLTIVETTPGLFLVNTTDDRVDAAPGDGVCDTGQTLAGADGPVVECSLRAAVMEANATPGADDIAVPDGTYTLTIAGNDAWDTPDASQGDLDVTETATIVGTGAATTVIQAGPDPFTGIDRVLESWNAGTTLTLRDLTVANGNPGGGSYVDLGGGVRNNGPAALTLERVTVTGNQAFCNGAGIFNWGLGANTSLGGTVRVVDSTITGNRAEGACDGGHGGGLSSDAGDVTVTGSTISDNTAGHDGGGLNLGTGTVVITDSTITGNTAGYGGGIRNGADTTVTDTTVDGNTASVRGGGIQTDGGSLTLTRVALTNNVMEGGTGDGGGLKSNGGAVTIVDSTVDGNTSNGTSGWARGAVAVEAGALTIRGTTIANNTATATGSAEGGGLWVGAPAGPVEVTNTTFSGNDAADGAAIRATVSAAHFTNVTVTGSTSTTGAVANDGGGTLTFAGSLVGDNVGPDCSTSGVSSGGANLDTDGTCFGAGGTDGTVASLLLGSLADNGGTTATHLPQAGSPAIDLDPAATCPTTDQRGAARAQDGDGDGTIACDAGAVEVPATTPPPAVPTGASWDFATDLLAAPGANPAGDGYGNVGVWSYLFSPSLGADASTYAPLPDVRGPDCATPGRTDWYDAAGETWLLVGAKADATTTCGAPSGRGALHPGTSHEAVVAWRSAYAGTVHVVGGLEDADAGGGDGIDWTIAKGHRNSDGTREVATVIASGGYDNGGAQAFGDGTGGAALAGVDVQPGDELYLIVDPRGSNANDDTNVDLTIDGPLAPNLTVAALADPPAFAAPGDTIEVGDTTADTGGDAPETTTGYWLSTDATRDGADLPLTPGRAVAPLTGSTDDAGTAIPTIPAETPPGTYRLIACADAADLVTETDETDNCTTAAETITVGTDLVPVATDGFGSGDGGWTVSGDPAAPPSVQPSGGNPGGWLSVTDAVASQTMFWQAPAAYLGDREAAYGGALVFDRRADAPGDLSSARDVVLTAGDGTELTADLVTTPGTAWSRTVLPLLPDSWTDTATGTVADEDTLRHTLADLAGVGIRAEYVTGGEVDGLDGVGLYRPAVIIPPSGPNLVTGDVRPASREVTAGGRLDVAVTTANVGTVALGATRTVLLLSADGVAGPDDLRLVGDLPVDALTPGALSLGTAHLQVPGGIAAGTYHLIACADDGDRVAEVDETDNCTASARQITVTAPVGDAHPTGGEAPSAPPAPAPTSPPPGRDTPDVPRPGGRGRR